MNFVSYMYGVFLTHGLAGKQAMADLSYPF